MSKLNISNILAPPTEFEDIEEANEYLKKLSSQLTDTFSEIENKFSYLKLDDLYTPDDNTDLNSSLTSHGLLIKLIGGIGSFLRSDGSWGTPGGIGADHNILSATHLDALDGSVVAGDLILGNATPKWARLAKGSSGQVLTMGGSLPSWSTPSTDADTLDTHHASYFEPSITAGLTTQYWRGDKTWQTLPTLEGGTPGGLDTQVQFNDGGVFGGSSNLTWDKTNSKLRVGDAVSTGLMEGPYIGQRINVGYGSNLSPITSYGLTGYFEKWSSVTLISGRADITLGATMNINGGTTGAIAIMGQAVLTGGTGDGIGVAGWAYNNRTSGGNVYGGWFVAHQTNILNNFTHGVEIEAAAIADTGYMTGPGVGWVNGLWIGPGSVNGTWGIAVHGLGGGKWHSGFVVNQDSIVPSSATENEAFLMQGGSTNGNKYTGMRYTGYFNRGIDLSLATIDFPIILANQAAIFARDVGGTNRALLYLTADTAPGILVLGYQSTGVGLTGVDDNPVLIKLSGTEGHQVLHGDADSGGTGYRMIRVLN